MTKKEVGKPFSPFQQFKRFSLVPNWLLHQKQITPGAKLCYARLVQYCGKNDYAFPRIGRLAEEMGMSERQVARYISELKKNKLIQVKRKGLGKPNHYYMLWHTWAEDELQQLHDGSAPPSLHEGSASALPAPLRPATTLPAPPALPESSGNPWGQL